jgi:hypothetical protein
LGGDREPAQARRLPRRRVGSSRPAHAGGSLPGVCGIRAWEFGRDALQHVQGFVRQQEAMVQLVLKPLSPSIALAMAAPTGLHEAVLRPRRGRRGLWRCTPSVTLRVNGAARAGPSRMRIARGARGRASFGTTATRSPDDDRREVEDGKRVSNVVVDATSTSLASAASAFRQKRGHPRAHLRFVAASRTIRVRASVPRQAANRGRAAQPA